MTTDKKRPAPCKGRLSKDLHQKSSTCPDPAQGDSWQPMRDVVSRIFVKAVLMKRLGGKDGK